MAWFEWNLSKATLLLRWRSLEKDLRFGRLRNLAWNIWKYLKLWNLVSLMELLVPPWLFYFMFICCCMLLLHFTWSTWSLKSSSLTWTSSTGGHGWHGGRWCHVVKQMYFFLRMKRSIICFKHFQVIHHTAYMHKYKFLHIQCIQCICIYIYIQHTSMYVFNMCLHLISGEDVRQSCAAEGVDSPCAGLAW